MRLTTFLTSLLLLLCLLSVQSYAQQVPASDIYQATLRGIALYESGDFERAASILKPIAEKTDSVKAYRYLGLSMERLGKPDDALKAHEKVVEIMERELDIATKSSSAPENLVAVLFQQALENAAASGADYIRLNQNLSGPELQRWTDRTGRLNQLVNAGKSTGLKFYNGSEVDTKVKILSKPQPTYTEKARNAGVGGRVALRVVLGADGNVMLIVPVKTLSHGLTEKAVDAARKIRFKPASNKGVPVHAIVQVEYNFSIYQRFTPF